MDTSRELPFLNELRRRGADGTMQVGLPSLSNPGRTVLATGAWAEVSGVTSNFARQRVEVDAIFSLARRAGLHTAVAGSVFWQRGFGPWIDEFLRTPEGPEKPSPNRLSDWQKADCARQINFARSLEAVPALLAVDLVAGDDASHDFGARSDAARQIFRLEDTCFSDLITMQELNRTVVIAEADHGHVARGGHGGDEPDVLAAPLVMAGGPIRRGITFQAQQTDVAPTICALLGLPLPASSEGRILLEAVDVDPVIAARLRAAGEQQKRNFGAFRASILNGTRAEAQARARAGRTRLALLIAGLLVALLAWVFAAVLRPGERLAAVVGLAGFWIVYALVFRLAGLSYSLTAVNKEEYLAAFFFRDMLAAGISLAAAAFAAGFAVQSSKPKVQGSMAPTLNFERGTSNFCLRLGAAVSLAVSLTLAITVVSAWWFDGLRAGAWLPNLKLDFMCYLYLLAAYALGFAVWLTPMMVWGGAKMNCEL